MDQNSSNKWFPSHEAVRVFRTLHNAAHLEHLRWLSWPNAKYLEIRLDMRTGAFIIKDSKGLVMTKEQIEDIFPELKD